MKVVVIIIFSISFVANSLAQTKQDYVYKYAPIAVSEMEIARIPASITLAQGLIESRYGTSQLSKRSNNHFGIKCHKNWTGSKVYHNDDKRGECFRSYNDPYLSFQDHSEFLNTRKRYSFLFQLDIKDYKGWAKGLKLAGYATDPSYANKLIRVIEEYELYQFDLISSAEVVHYVQQLKGGEKPIQYVSTPKQKKPSKTILEKKQATGGPAGTPEDATPYSRKEFSVNHIKTVHSFAGDSPKTLAEKYKISESRLTTYNEWNKYRNEFYYGMNVFLQPKRSKSRDVKTKVHKVKAKETMYQIAQNYGLKTSSLYVLNRMDEEKQEQPRTGERIYLRKKRKTKPVLRNEKRTHSTKKPNLIQKVKKKATTIQTPKVSLSKLTVKKKEESKLKSESTSTQTEKQELSKNAQNQITKPTTISKAISTEVIKKKETKTANSSPPASPIINNSKTGVITIKTPDPFGQPTVHAPKSTEQPPKRVQVPSSQTPSVTKVVDRTTLPPLDYQEVEQKPVQPISPVSEDTVQKKVEYVYPQQNVKKVKQTDQYEGRAIIYEPTPAVNSKPVEIYKPTQKKQVKKVEPTKTKSSIHSNISSIKQIHKVKKGDTLYSLSKKYGVTVKQLKTWNKLSSSGIKIGQKLIVTQ